MRHKRFWSIVAACGIALVAFLLTGPAQFLGQKAAAGVVSMAASDSYVYRLELEGIPIEGTAVYAECSGLGSSSDIEEQKVVTERGVVAWQQSPGALRWDNIRLTRDSLGSMQIWQWRRSVEEGRLAEAMKSGSIIMLGSSSNQVYARWVFHNGWPARLSFNEGVEELVIVHDGLEFVGSGYGGGTAPVKKR